MNENIISLSLPNVLTIGIILLIWVAIWAVVGQAVRRSMGSQSTSDVVSAGMGAAGLPT